MKSGSRGYVMLEVMLAAGIFFMVAVGFTQALQSLVDAALFSRKEKEAVMQLQSFVDQLGALSLREGEEVLYDEPDLKILRTVEPTEFTNQLGQALSRLYLVKFKATWEDSTGREFERATEVFYSRP